MLIFHGLSFRLQSYLLSQTLRYKQARKKLVTWQLMTQNSNIPEMTKCWGRNVLVLAHEIILEINVCSQLNENTPPHTHTGSSV